ncbi:MAG: Uroporphyrinogen decarboxylase (URO-D) [candidate division TA06 bacterium ADurb.Bin417]|uniref:Uroporphyrinogen decarboxylase (URO-D) n=1 Tax=candidate division TA06 bacterium ADurb.Bin417 TaxID=1852828 RepID=A0A1V5M8N1_UNCT6|nr:MAG: Uroporphyrinogen decarboxylase (URO-D) [candidate division TA06 bacterium ADurb.Bin417]
MVAIQDWFGLDRFQIRKLSAMRPEYGQLEKADRLIADLEGYRRLKDFLYPGTGQATAWLAEAADAQRNRDIVTGLILEGPFWFPRILFGIEAHLYAFYDHPEAMRLIIEDLADYHLRILEAARQTIRPELVLFSEDMSYNHGPMLSRKTFDEFISPYYRRIVPRLKEFGWPAVIDSDGQIGPLLEWFAPTGVDAFLPLEHQAGVDIVELRRRHPRHRFIGAFDKMVLNRGEAAVEAEFERLRPVMAGGGYVPGVDHQTPPGVSLAEYRDYLVRLAGWCRRAAG